ncbi:MAG: hypothetical protein GC162_18760 [Planctomycetes bacterium]|nr:hypothetical protein [Planctomycetota bacterium]
MIRSRNDRQTRRPLVLAALAALSLAGVQARGGLIVDDAFNDGGLTNGADPNDAAWTMATGGGPLSIVNDNGSPGLNGGNAIQLTTTGTFQGFTGLFSPITLTEDRQRIKLIFDYRLTDFGNQDAALRFGLLDSASAVGTADSAYFVATSTGTINTATLNQTYSGTATGYLGGSVQYSQGTDNNVLTSDNNPHHVEFIVQRTTADRIDLSARIGTGVISGADTTGKDAGPLQTTFDSIAFETGNNNNGANIGGITPQFRGDNYRVEIWNNVFDDNFDTGASPTTGNDGDDPNDAAWTAIGGSIALVTDDNLAAGQIGSNKAMSFTTSGTFQKIRTQFTDTPDIVGTKVSASFDFRVVNAENVAAGLRFGLYDDGSNTAADTGYFVSIATGTATGVTFIEDGSTTQGDFLGGGGQITLGTVANYDLDESVAHFAQLLLEHLSATTMRLSLYIDGVFIGSALDTSVTTTHFGAFGISSGGTSNDFIIDNVSVDYMVPAPAALPAGLALFAGLILRRRR